MRRREFIKAMAALPLAGVTIPSTGGSASQIPVIDIGEPVFSPRVPDGSDRDVMYFGQAVRGSIKEVAGQCRRWVVFFRAAVDSRGGVGVLGRARWKAGQIVHIAGSTPRCDGIPRVHFARAYGRECEPSARTMAAMAALDNADWGYRYSEGLNPGGAFFHLEVNP